MNIFDHVRQRIEAACRVLQAEGVLPADLPLARLTVEAPRDSSHGDVATNVAMVLGKIAGMAPRALAELLAGRLQTSESIAAVEVAGPGFINIRLSGRFWTDELATILKTGRAYGDSTLGGGHKVNVEYVSTNPTGPLHIGHCRGAVYGDALAALLSKAGFDVTKEYYVNDAGAQIDTLARSTYLRYREALGEDIGDIPEGFYPGDYLKPVGAAIAEADGKRWLGRPEAEWLETFRLRSTAAMMDLIRADLAALGIEQEVFTSELDLQRAGKVDEAIGFMDRQGLLYEGVLEPPRGKRPDDWEARPQTLFRSTEFGDDVDRAIRKADGSWTYFASDIAYHYDKFERGFAEQILVVGADHGGYVLRLKAVVKALTGGQGSLDIKICRLVRLSRAGTPVKMSKRAGTMVSLGDLVAEVGKDVVRFIMLTRRNDAPLDFDFVKVTEQSRDNPVFYVQYAHARCHSVLRNAAAEFPDLAVDAASLAGAPLERLDGAPEVALIRKLAEWPRLVEAAASAHEPHRVAFYLYDLAAAFHAFWNRGNEDPALRFIVAGDRTTTSCRLALVQGVATVVAAGLDIMGVEPVEEMH